MELVKEESGLIEAFLGERVVLEVVTREKGFDVVKHCGLAVINIIVNVLGKFFHPRTLFYNFHSISNVR